MFREKVEKRLIKGCLKGKPEAQKMLYDLYSPKMMGVCLRYAKNREEAEDIMQEGFIRVFTKLDTFKNKGSLEGWVRRVIVNTALRHIQKNARFLANVGWEDVDYEMGENETVASNLAYEELLALVNELPDGYRMIFNLYAIDGFSHKEISQKLGISEGTSKSQLARARKYLIREIRKQENFFELVSDERKTG